MTDHSPKTLPFDPAWLAIGVAGVVLVGSGLLMMNGGSEPEAPPVVVLAPAVPATPAPEAPAPGATATPAPADTTPPAAPAAVPAAAPTPAAGPAEALRAVAELRQAMEQAEARREAGDAAIEQRLAALEARLGPLAERLEAASARAGRLAALDALRRALDAGRPLGAALAALGGGEAPAALARYAEAAPPTEAALRLSFDDALRAARAEIAAGQTRGIGSLFTVRRGDEVLWGDAQEATLEHGRRTLNAGDLAGALAVLGELPETHRAPLAGWIAEAEALAAARAALAELAGA